MVKQTQCKVSRLITPSKTHRRYDHDQTMAFPNTLPSKNTTVLHSYKNSQTNSISKSQKSYLKDTTDFINFIQSTKVKNRTFLVSMDVTSLYTNVPQNEGIDTVCIAYDNFYKDSPPIPTHYLREMLRLILKENSFQFNGKHYLQIHGTAMGTKTAVSFANLYTWQRLRPKS